MLYQQRVRQEVEKCADAIVLRLPQAVKWAASITPARLQQHVFARGLNHFLRAAIAAGDLDFFSGKTLTVSISDLGVGFSIRFINQTLKVSAAEATADVRLSASSYDLLLIATQRLDPDTLFFLRRLEMNGDTHLGLGIKNLLASIELTEQLNARVARELLRFVGCVERCQQQ